MAPARQAGPANPVAPSDSTGTGANRRPVSRAAIISYARRLLGTPYRHQGRQPGCGLDCIGLVVVVARHFGLSDHDVHDYPRLPEGDRLLGEARRAGFIPVGRARPGDVICLRTARDPQHLAIVTDIGMLHACARRERVIEHRIDATWRERIVAAFRFPGVD